MRFTKMAELRRDGKQIERIFLRKFQGKCRPILYFKARKLNKQEVKLKIL